MIVKIRTVGVQSPRLSSPDGDGFSRLKLADASTIRGLIKYLDPEEPDHLAVFLNDEQVVESRYGDTILVDGAELVLLRPIDGGKLL
ncbi:MAG: MoaD/ThiS family protein [Rhodospirillales bacterium]|nr:MoaD/ThiS family protein [Rhodospirillales bacterium]